MSLAVPIRLRSLETLVVSLHGGPRPLTLSERDLLAEVGADIVTDIRDAWPRDTGFSAARWSFTLTASTGAYELLLENDAAYAEYVHAQGETTPLYQSLIPQVVARYRDVLLDRLRPAIQDTEDTLARDSRPARVSFLDLLQRRVATP